MQLSSIMWSIGHKQHIMQQSYFLTDTIMQQIHFSMKDSFEAE